MIKFATRHEVDDDDKENDPDAYIKAVAKYIEKVSALKDEPSCYFSHRAYVMRCYNKHKATTDNSKNKVSADE